MGTFGPMPPARDDVPPDPRPVQPTFPFAEARAAVAAIDDLIDALRTFSTQQGGHAAQLFTADFAGTFRQRLEQHLDQSVTDVDGLWRGGASVLEQDRAALVRAIEAAESRQDDWQVSLDRWQARQDAPVAGAA